MTPINPRIPISYDSSPINIPRDNRTIVRPGSLFKTKNCRTNVTDSFKENHWSGRQGSRICCRQCSDRDSDGASTKTSVFTLGAIDRCPCARRQLAVWIRNGLTFLEISEACNIARDVQGEQLSMWMTTLINTITSGPKPTVNDWPDLQVDPRPARPAPQLTLAFG